MKALIIFVNLNTEPRIVPKALENFGDPRVGPLGPEWKKYPQFKIPDCRALFN